MGNSQPIHVSSEDDEKWIKIRDEYIKESLGGIRIYFGAFSIGPIKHFNKEEFNKDMFNIIVLESALLEHYSEYHYAFHKLQRIERKEYIITGWLIRLANINFFENPDNFLKVAEQIKKGVSINFWPFYSEHLDKYRTNLNKEINKTTLPKELTNIITEYSMEINYVITKGYLNWVCTENAYAFDNNPNITNKWKKVVLDLK